MEFRRTDLIAVVELVRGVAEVADPGEHGDGVEVVIEAPRRGWLGRVLDDGLPEQARIAVTKFGGAVRYPFHVQLVTDQGGRAADRLPRLPGWTVSNSGGRHSGGWAFLMQKGEGDRFDWAALVGGALAGLSALRPDAVDAGWRAGVDRGSGVVNPSAD